MALVQSLFVLFLTNTLLVQSATRYKTHGTSDPLYASFPEVLVSASARTDNTCGKAWITKQAVNDSIIINWSTEHCQLGAEPDEVVLYVVDRGVSFGVSRFIKHRVAKSSSVSRNEASLQFNTGEKYSAEVPSNWADGPQCLPYWVETRRGGELLYRTCLSIQPNWMEIFFEQLSPIRFKRLTLAGTHNAGSYQFDTGISSSDSDRWILCQGNSVLEQLIFGNRYLDIRIGYYPLLSEQYWLNHNLIRIRSLRSILEEVRTFMDATTHEVVIFDIHHFPVGFDRDGAHQGLLELIEEVLKDHIAPMPSRPNIAQGDTFSDMVNSGKRLVISYADVYTRNDYEWLWPQVSHLWANSNDPEYLFSYLDQQLTVNRDPWHSAMAQTTPTTLDIVLQRGSLRENADKVNTRVTDRLRGLWSDGANIVSTDFFLGSDVVNVAIDINLKKHVQWL